MITPDREQAQAGSGDFHDVVAVEFWDADADLFGYLRIARAPNEATAAVGGVLFAGGEPVLTVAEPSIESDPASWDAVEVGPAKLSIVEPLARWAAALAQGDCGFEITLDAVTAPLELIDSALIETAGTSQYEQICTVRGTVRVNGRGHKLNGKGRRVHTWGAPDWTSVATRRSLFVALAEDDGGLAILAARPAGTPGHDAEQSAGYVVPSGGNGEPASLDQILLSTVYDREGRPDSAGLELYIAGEEFARRATGKAFGKVQFDLGGRRHRISFFHWSLDGAVGRGSYQTISAL